MTNRIERKWARMSQISITEKLSRKGNKKWYYLEWGKAADQRRAAGIFTYLVPKCQTHKIHNKEALALLEVKKVPTDARIPVDRHRLHAGT